MIREDQAGYWDRVFAAGRGGLPYDGWLDPFAGFFDGVPGGRVLELGCGSGRDTRFLTGRGIPVTACDVSPKALELLREELPGVRTVLLDLRDPLPFSDGWASAVIADLCLHYFDGATTRRIFADIRRVLRPGGLLLFRVNSAADVHFGAGMGTEVEVGYYLHDGHYKRFFDETMVRSFLARWEILHLERKDIPLSGAVKNVYEVVAAKTT